MIKKIIEENELLLNESLSEDKKERANCVKIIRTNLNRWLKSYWKNNYRSNDKYAKSMANASGDILLYSVNTKNFINNNTNEIEYRIGTKSGPIMIGLSILSVVLTGYTYIQTGMTSNNRNAMANHISSSKTKKEIEEYLAKETGYNISIKMGDKNKSIIVTAE